ncbi:hypothetical protein GX645_03115 [Candidatus Sumerlaeota bacterium]|nr:hypothetical protein [Candidatus Sumerlaeales bacterium]NLD61426.1 hypothetical protein [Candidatus Sumerlaeota bacterium]
MIRIPLFSGFGSARYKSIFIIVLVLIGLAVMPSCKFTNLKKLPGRLPAGIMPTTFTTPIKPTYSGMNLTLQQIAGELQKRKAVRNLKGKFKVYTGTLTGMGTQTFDVLCGLDRPRQNIRLRASQNYGTLLDVLIKDGRFEAQNFAEKTTVNGTIAQLEANPSITAGMMPVMLFDVIGVQDTLLDRFARSDIRTWLRHTPGAYRIDIVRPDRSAERFILRDSDLLITHYARYRDNLFLPNRTYFTADYTGYRTAGKNTYVPSGFVISAFQGEVGVIVEEAETNITLPPAMFVMENRPEGFRNIRL